MFCVLGRREFSLSTDLSRRLSSEFGVNVERAVEAMEVPFPIEQRSGHKQCITTRRDVRCDELMLVFGESLLVDQYGSFIASAVIQRKSALGWIIRLKSLSAPLDIVHFPTHLPRS